MKCLLYRAFSICSNFELVHAEFVKLKDLLLRNGYPVRLIDSLIKQFLDKRWSSSPSVPIVEKLHIYLCIPFTGKHGLDLRTRMHKLLRDRFPQLSVRFVFIPSLRIRNLFCFKDRFEPLLRSGVVYNFTCADCNVSYIGKTIRQLGVRIHEHLGVSVFTGKKLSSPVFSAIRDHCSALNHNCSASDFEIMNQVSNNFDLAIYESLLIQKYMPVLNNSQPVKCCALYS